MKKMYLFLLFFIFFSFTFSQIPKVTRWMGPYKKKSKILKNYKRGLDLSEIYKSSNFNSHKRRTLIFFENNLYGELKISFVNDYFKELEKSSYSIDVFEYHSGTPEEIKNFVKSYYNSTCSLDGVIFIGDLPYVVYEMIDDWGIGSSEYDDFACDLFYMDLTGTWEDVGDCDECEADNGKYDKIEDSGNNFLEIWVSRIFPGHMTDHQEYIDVINNYLERVAKFREKEVLTYDTALIYDDDDWDDLRGEDVYNLLKLFEEDKINAPAENPKGNVCTAYNYKTEELPRNYQMVYLRSHGYPGGHGFYENFRQDFNYVFLNDYLSKVGNVAFYLLFVCSGCDFSSTDNTMGFLGGRTIFNEHGGLLSLGSTKTGGIWDDAYFFDKLSQPESFGRGFVYWLNNALKDYPDIGPPWWYGMVLIGDGSLYFHPHRMGDLNCDGKIDAVDTQLLAQYLISNIGDNELDSPSADINMDGKINTVDLLELMKELSQ